MEFSRRPQLIDLNGCKTLKDKINEMYKYNDCSNTDIEAVFMLILQTAVNANMMQSDLPDRILIVSDMEFDRGSMTSKDDTMKLFKSKGYNTKIVWWNLNSRNITCPEMDADGNIFLSGYNPILLKYLQVGFDNGAFLDKLLSEYSEAIK